MGQDNPTGDVERSETVESAPKSKDTLFDEVVRDFEKLVTKFQAGDSYAGHDIEDLAERILDETLDGFLSGDGQLDVSSVSELFYRQQQLQRRVESGEVDLAEGIFVRYKNSPEEIGIETFIEAIAPDLQDKVFALLNEQIAPEERERREAALIQLGNLLKEAEMLLEGERISYDFYTRDYPDDLRIGITSLDEGAPPRIRIKLPRPVRTRKEFLQRIPKVAADSLSPEDVASVATVLRYVAAKIDGEQGEVARQQLEGAIESMKARIALREAAVPIEDAKE